MNQNLLIKFNCNFSRFPLDSCITMNKGFRTFLGIDVGMGPKPVTFVALDEDQQALAIGEGDVHDALSFAAGLTGRTLVAVDAAARPNNGRMAQPEVRKLLKPPPPKGKFKSLRQVEYELIQAGMNIPETPGQPERSLPWVRRGFSLVEKLESLNYVTFSDEEAPRQWLETNADAAFWSLLGVVPLMAGTLEGRIQRQLALLDEDLKVPDAMDFFEEVTRFKILKSNLPIQDIFPQAELNAWMAAHTAWLAANQPGRVRIFGEPEEGIIYLPCRD